MSENSVALGILIVFLVGVVLIYYHPLHMLAFAVWWSVWGRWSSIY